MRAARIAGLASGLLLLPAAAPLARVEATVTNVRSNKGVFLICLTSDRANFPKCPPGPLSRSLSVPARNGAKISFANLPAGDYAIALVHDENDNRKLDTLMAMPREGFGFSRNPTVTIKAPSFAASAFHVAGGVTVEQQIKVKYFL